MDNDNNHKKGQSRKKTDFEKDSTELHWESHNPIRMNRYNVNQNLAEKHDPLKKRRLIALVKLLLPVLAGAIAVLVFILFCLNVGHKFKETTAAEETTFFSELTTKAINEETIEDESRNVIAESVVPGDIKEDIFVMGGKGELIGFSFPDTKHKKWMLLKAHFDTVLHSAGYKSSFRFASEEVSDLQEGTEDYKREIVSQQAEDIKNLAEDGAKIIFVAPGDVTSRELGDVLNDVKNSGVYIISLDHVPMNTSGVNYLFGYDDYHVGETIGKYVVDKLELDSATAEEPKTAEIFTGDITDETLMFLYPGLMETLFPYIDKGVLVVGSGQMELEQVSVLETSEEAAYERMKTTMELVYTARNLDAVICTDDVLAGGVSRAIVEAVLAGTYGGKMPVITGDGCDDAALDRILQGTQSMSILHEPKEYAYKGTELADAIIHGGAVNVIDSEMYQNGKLVVPACELQPVVVNAGNYEEMIVKRGYLLTTELLD